MKNPSPEEQKKPLAGLNDPQEHSDEVPLEAFEVGAENTVTRYRNMVEVGMTTTPPANCNLGVLGVDALGKVALANGLGTNRPPKVVAALDAAKRFFYLFPVASDYAGGIELIYDGPRCTMTLYKVLAAVDRLVPDGMRDFYPLQPTKSAIKIGKLQGYALYCKLADVRSERMGTLSEETRAKRAETRRRNLERKKNGGQAADAR